MSDYTIPLTCGCRVNARDHGWSKGRPGDAAGYTYELEGCPLHQAAGELLGVVKHLTKNWQPVVNGDWACVECKPNSDMLIEGFRCAYHRGLTLVALIEGTRPEEG